MLFFCQFYSFVNVIPLAAIRLREEALSAFEVDDTCYVILKTISNRDDAEEACHAIGERFNESLSIPEFSGNTHLAEINSTEALNAIS